MNRLLRDPRVSAPALLAAAALAFRVLPPPPPSPPPRPVAVRLPAVHGAPEPKGAQQFELNLEASAAQFCLAGSGEPAWIACRGLQGSLRLEPDGTGTLELDLDLGSLQPLAGAAVDLPMLLGVQGHDHVRYRASLHASTRIDLPGVRQLLWLGELRLGPVRRRQPMQMWLCTLPAQPPRLLGHGVVEPTGLGLRRSDGLGSAALAVTLGLDLAWRRVRK